jgi:AcrR family transcriptional regulator
MAGNKNSGRNPLAPSEDDRKKVRVLRACGMSLEAIAEAMGLAVKTLTKHFSADMEIATAKVTAEVMMARYEEALKGNVSAQNKLLEQVGAAKAQERRAPVKEPKLGKKEERQIAAENVGGRFAPPQAPKLVVSNDR